MKPEELLGLRNVFYFPHQEVHTGRLILGEGRIVISPGARMDLTGSVTIGEWSMIGEGTKILTHDHFHAGRKPLLLLQDKKGVQWKDKIIGKDVWLHGCIVLFQVDEIPDGVIVGCGSVLTKNPKPYEIWAGSPAKKIGER